MKQQTGREKAYIDARSEVDTLIRQVEVAYKEKKKDHRQWRASPDQEQPFLCKETGQPYKAGEMCPKSRRLSCSGQPRNCAPLQECLEYKRFQS